MFSLPVAKVSRSNTLLNVPAVVPDPKARFGLPKLTATPSVQLRLPLPAEDVALPVVDNQNAASVTAIATLSVSLRGPPLPVLPRSLVTICSDADPVYAAVGAKLIPLSAALMLAIEPVKVIVAFAVPLPTLKPRPEVPASVTVPLVAVRVT